MRALCTSGPVDRTAGDSAHIRRRSRMSLRCVACQRRPSTWPCTSPMTAMRSGLRIGSLLRFTSRGPSRARFRWRARAPLLRALCSSRRQTNRSSRRPARATVRELGRACHSGLGRLGNGVCARVGRICVGQPEDLNNPVKDRREQDGREWPEQPHGYAAVRGVCVCTHDGPKGNADCQCKRSGGVAAS